MVAVFVLTVFLLFLIVDIFVLKLQGKYHPAFEPQFSQFEYPIFERQNFTIPSNIYLSKGHTWLKPNNEGFVLVGIDEFGHNALGSLSISNYPETGKRINRGDILFEGAYEDKKVKFFSPLTGIVSSTNKELIDNKVTDPYKTWGVKFLTKDFAEHRENFYNGKDAINYMKDETSKLKNFINNHLPEVEAAGTTMYDGGLLTNETVASLNEISIIHFEKEFLSL